MKHKFKLSVKLLVTIFFIGLIMTSCEKSDPAPDVEPEEKRIFTVGFGDGSTGSSKTYVQGLTDLSKGTISYDGFGFEVPSSRTARIFASEDGKSLYDLDYGGGRIYKFDVEGGEKYTKVAETNVEFAMGTKYPRWTKASEDYALLHYVKTERVYDDADKYIGTTSTARLMSVNLTNLEIGTIEEFEIPRSGVDDETLDYVSRIDAPIIVGNKAYYGMTKSGYDPDLDIQISATFPNVETLVVDYPSLKNPKIISTNVGGARGGTNGYRTPVSYEDDKGDVYQITSFWDSPFDTHILKITNGDYDDSYDFNFASLIGTKTASVGWFYVGNGIGYVPYADLNKGGSYSDNNWSVARVDLYNKTAIKLNLPEGLWLVQYQNGVVHDEKFYMAIGPKGEDGNIYIFDPTSTDPNGFTKGADLKSGADAFYIGIY